MLANPRYYFAIFALVLLFTAGLYGQGLNGVFIFDDDQNLGYLSLIDKTDYWVTTAQFLSEGMAGTLGRPISLLSFALQHEAYPDNIQALKAVNIILHLLNGCLVFLFIALLARLLKFSTQHGLFLALCTASIWLLNPLQVSTVLYVIQRMTQFATFFSLLGLVVYLLGREAIAYNKPIRGFLLVSGGIGLGLILAAFSKENGILLALLVLVLEWTVLSQYTKPRYWTAWLALFAYLPMILLLLYFTGVVSSIRQIALNDLLLYLGLLAVTIILIETMVWAWVKKTQWKKRFRALFYTPLALTILAYSFNPDVILNSYAIRDFTLTERLLTQARILIEYIAKMTLVYPVDFGLFHDDYIISRGLYDPTETALAVTVILSLIGFALWTRKIYPFIAFGILWFFAGHILESSFVGLVLYFEHRNYLPSIGIIFVLVYGFWVLMQSIAPRHKYLFSGFAVLWLLAGMSLTWSEIALWSNPVKQAGVWAAYKPESRYAQSQAASIAVQLDKPEIAEQYYHKMLRTFPEDSDPYMMLLLLACHYPDDVVMPDIQQEILPHLQQQTVNTGSLSSIIMLLDELDQCEKLSIQDMDMIFNALIHNAKTSNLAIIYNLYALFKAQMGDYLAAIDAISQSLDLSEQRSPELYFSRIQWAFATQDMQLASLYLNTAYQEFTQFRQYAYQKQLNYWRTRIELFNQSQTKP
ncbi:hypothetical protein [Candidatus Albibeggiatoa sp. nov. NOAA]|uniref:hypothetical protein n=1 Tax=Candidatus Albibeggiatoa sp. nov. NOAA TaxID=3162724 RepID=UPI0032FEC1C0|nr:hypothetical protein [Thiotrichaceae bacterium]